MGRFGRSDYDQRTPFADIPADEPLFVIRGRDRAAPDTLRAYARFIATQGADRATVLSVERHAVAMEDFQKKHGSKVADIG